MTNKIEITSEGVSVHGVGTTTAPLDVMQSLLSTSFIPHFVRLLSPEMCVLEYNPRLYSVHASSQNGGANYAVFNIPMPWLLWVHRQTSVGLDSSQSYILCRSKQLHSLDDEVCYVPLSHIHSDTTPCWNDTPSIDRKLPIWENAQRALNHFFATNFRGGMYYAWPGYNNNQSLVRYMPDAILKPCHEIFKAVLQPAHIWVNDVAYFEWLESQSIDDTSSWDLKPAGKLRDFLGASPNVIAAIEQAVRTHPKQQTKA